MKTKTIWTICLLFIGTSMSMAQNTPFKEFLQMPLVKSSFITKPMLDLAADTEIGSITIEDLENRLEQVEIYNNVRTGNSMLLASAMKKIAIENIESNNYNLTLCITEGETVITFYSKTANDNKDVVSDLIMMSYKPDNNVGVFTLIRLVGNLTFDDLKEINPKKDKNRI